MVYMTCLDLFCGCGGFSLGVERAGLQVLAAIDNDPAAITVFFQNFPNVPHILECDLTKFSPEELYSITKTKFDVIIGGPPCQGFSVMRRENFGPADDSRRHLYKEFLAYVAYFRPKIFVMENVQGIKIIAGGKIYAQILAEFCQLGYKIFCEDVCAWFYGVPQKRVRHFIFGLLPELPNPSLEKFMLPQVTLWEAIGDLPPLAAGESKNEYDLELRKQHLAKYGGRYIEQVIEVHKTKELTAHYARPHLDRDLRDMAKMLEGETLGDALRRGVEFEWPCPKKGFRDKYIRQHRDKLCSTILANLGKNWLRFIHPTQNRSITPREAARIQSFPDWFKFPVQQSHQFRLIGNAVPPLVGEAIGKAIREILEGCPLQ